MGESAEDIKKVIDDFLDRSTSIAAGKKAIFGMICGSKSFNLNLQSSDTDYFGVYVADIDQVLSLHQPPESIDKHDPDAAIYEILKFCHLIPKGNPKLIEPLWTERFCFQSDEWQDLKQIRNCVFSKHTVSQYVGFALSKLSDYRKGKGTDPKSFYHAVRLIKEAKNIANNTPPRVWWENEERESLLAIRRGEFKAEELVKEIDAIQKEIEGQTRPDLREETDIAPLNRWLLNIRMNCLKQKAPVEPMLHPVSSTNLHLKSLAEQLLLKHKVQGTVLAVIPSGSKAYGTQLDSSSDDYIGIYVAPLEQVLSMHPPSSRVDELGVESEQKIAFTRGLTLFEVGQACELLCGGNHRLIEAIFYENSQNCFETFAWQELKKLRNSFVSQSVVNHCTGVVQGKLQAKHTSPEEEIKTLYQAVRILSETVQLLKNGRFDVVLPQNEFLMQIRRGEVPKEKVMEVIEQKKEEIKELKNKTKLSQKTDKKEISQWLVQLRKSTFVSN